MKYNIYSLPRWAQDHVASLEGQVKELRDLLAKATCAEPSAISFGRDSALNPQGYLPDMESVTFRLTPEDAPWKQWVQVRIRRDELFVMCSDACDIRPSASNTFTVGISAD